MHKLHMAWDRIARIEGGTARPISPATPPRPLHIPHRPLRWARRNVLPKARVSLQAPSMRTLSVFLSCAALACVSEHGPLTNRMAQSGTHYLTRAARQPVSWQPWGREAFALAARLDRPVLLYVGADECRWCAVMDREVYGDPALGAMIDSLFVPVRVDRDERPDVARRYEAAVQWLAGLRGYPVTAFLTPDGSAFFGGTYFPADDPVTGRGLKQLLPEVAKSYREQRGVILQRAALVRQLAVTHAQRARGVLQRATVGSQVAGVRTTFQAAAGTHAALGSFMHTQAVSLLLATYGRTGDTSYLNAARTVLDFMVDSGEAATADVARDDPPSLVRAGLGRNLAVGWALTGTPLDRDFADSIGGGYFDAVLTDPAAPALPDRAKPVLDDLLPGANAWAARVLLQLADATGDARYRRRAEATLEAFAGALAGEGVRASSYLLAAQHVLAAR